MKTAQHGIVIAGYGADDCLMAGALLCLRELEAGMEPELRLCSREKLAGELRLLLASGVLPASVQLVGIGLKTHARELVQTLRALADKGCKLRWYSACPMAEWQRRQLAGRLEMVVEHKALPQLIYEHAGPWGRRGATALALRDYAGSGELLRFCRAAGFVNRVMPSARGREMLGLFLSAVRAGGVTPLSGKLASYVRVAEQASLRELKGESAAMEGLKDLARRAAAVDKLRVMIFGESGTGKESVANYIHLHSARWNKPFLAVNCASTNPGLQEAAFQGYRRGAFTGAHADRKGYFEQVDGGTLFLDEVGELSLEAQALLLRILEEGRVLPLGAQEEICVNVRLIAATNKDLWSMVDEGRFREDLLYRLQEFTLRTAALREVPEDIPCIANAMWWELCGEALPEEAKAVLQSYDWPGNARELSNVLKFALAMGEGSWEELLASYVAQNGRRAHRARKEDSLYPDLLKDAMAQHCLNIYRECGSNVLQAAARLGIERSTLRRHLGRNARPGASAR